MRSQPLDQRIALARRFNDSLLPLFQAGKLQPFPVRTLILTRPSSPSRYAARAVEWQTRHSGCRPGCANAPS